MTIIFPGAGGKYYDKERKSYDKRVIVMFQRKAWVDRATAIAWVHEMRPHNAKYVRGHPVTMIL